MNMICLSGKFDHVCDHLYMFLLDTNLICFFGFNCFYPCFGSMPKNPGQMTKCLQSKNNSEFKKTKETKGGTHQNMLASFPR